MPTSPIGKLVLGNYVEPAGSVRGATVAIARLEITRQAAPSLTQFYGWLYAYYLHGEAVAGYKFALVARRAITDGGVLLPIQALNLPMVAGESFAGYQLVSFWDVSGISYNFSV